MGFALDHCGELFKISVPEAPACDDGEKRALHRMDMMKPFADRGNIGGSGDQLERTPVCRIGPGLVMIEADEAWQTSRVVLPHAA
jgi:hypothetical protein